MNQLVWLLSAASAALASTSSSGCGGDTPYDLNTLYEESVESNGTTRSYYINLPENYDSDTAAPLILSFHGYGGSAKSQISTDQFTNTTWNPDYIVIYPEADGGWQGAPYATHGVDDLLFTSNLLDNLTSTLCIDTSRIYCAGKSIGGGFCNMIACDPTLSASFAAIAPVSGAFYTTPANESFNLTCQPAHPMPVLEFHGDLDTVIPYTGGENNGIDLLSIVDWARDWAITDGCSSDPTELIAHQNDSEVLHASYSCGSDSAYIVQHYLVDDLGHKWPTDGWNAENDGNTAYINASPIILDFFSNWTLADTASGTGSSTDAGTGATTTSTGASSGTATATATTTSSAGAGMVSAFPGVAGIIALGALVL